MPKATAVQSSFTSGELAPRMGGRIDVDRYFSGLKTLENKLITPFGSTEKVPGTMYVANAKHADKKCRLIKFVYSADDAYTIEFGDYYMRFFKNNGQLVVSSADAWTTPTAYVVGNYVTESGTIYYCIVAHTSGTFATDLAAGKWVAQTIYEVPTPYTEAQLFDVQYVTTGDIGYFTHPSHPVYKISRFADTSWTFAELDYAYPPFFTQNSTTTHTMTASAVSSTVTITSSTGYFTADFVGTPIELNHGGTKGYAIITVFTNTTTVTAVVQENFAATSATSAWRIGFGGYAGYPRAVTLHDRRLYLAGASLTPHRFWGSRIDQYNYFKLLTNDDEPFQYTIASDNINGITWLVSARELSIGTSGGVFVASGGTASTGITPTNILVRKQNNYGCSTIYPQKISNYVYYATRNNKKIRELIYNYDIDGYQSNDVTLLSEHITGDTGIISMDYQQSPNNIMWHIRNDGQIACMTREPEQQVLGWSRIKEDQRTDDTFESLTVIPTTTEDQVWLSSKRSIDGSDVRYIEYMKPVNFADQESMFFVRCGLTYDGGPATTISGLDHLEGETVDIIADGLAQTQKTVSSGSITIDTAASVVHVGLPYYAKIVGLNIEAGSANGTAQTKKKRVNKVGLRVYNTMEFKLGIEGSELDAKNVTTTLVTDDKVENIRGGSDRGWNIEVSQDKPYPLTVLLMVPYLTTNDG